ncbi:cellulose synthase-like protein H1 isoform X1 [Juglans microcarpa x Juglans regia]|uniref:cellulose synthase-like protein H1 isoform X1 n=1 Tax=Juglans microcarpa x Juglans regia TaxID=2249226 RepID=UPI001B7DA598|nr:cellulose synthase-like protein H1 isoform X1 [Juglans microcarpa x Juglans regia]
MASLISLPLYEKTPLKNTLQRTLDIIIFFLLLSLLTYRLLHLKNHGPTWLLAFLCESWFTFVWSLVLNIKWNRVIFKTYPDHLLQRGTDELPSVDMFVTTADPVLEPPIITVNTVLSLLAVDYPAHKLACYVSDDGCSLLTYYSLVEASKFAQLWVPFCRKYDIQVRAPFRYFSNDPIITFSDSTKEFQHEWKRMKNEYEQLSNKIEVAVKNSVRPCDFTGDFAEFSNVERRNHPTIIKVLWENKECLPDGLPHLVYISREKKHKHPHHYKAGAMNALTRVSALMTNAPYMLNVDCDMFVNNPKVVLHAMCVLLDSKSESEIAYVQFPQRFYDGLNDDPYGNQLVVLFEYIARGIDGIQGPIYGGTGCFHRRKIIYGLSPDNVDSIDGKLAEALLSGFGHSKEFIKSAVDALKGKTGHEPNINLHSYVEATYQIASCGYEYGTSWGTKMGWIYGSTAEDVNTGQMIQKKGWRSAPCTPDPPAFLGCAPSSGPATMTQQKRWATGLLEILFSKSCPIFASLSAKLQWRQCVAYLWILTWGLRPIFELCYAALSAYCIIADSHFLPKVQEPALYIPVSLFLTYNIYTLSEYLRAGQSVRAWWNNQRMARVTIMTAWLFGFLSVLLKLLGLSEAVFEVTQKEQASNDGDDNDVGRFTFNESPIFVPGTTILLVHLTTLVVSLLKLQHTPAYDGRHAGSGLGEAFCSAWLVLCFWPFFKGLFGKGKYGIPKATIYKSATLAFLFMYWCRRIAMG